MSKGEEKEPDISVCVANYNGGRYVLDCLASVYAQERDFSLEVLLHDDCSGDDSLAAVRAEFPAVSVLTSSTNVGFCVSNNRMVGRAKGRYVLLLNNDATLRPGALATLLAYADSGHQMDILGLPQCPRGSGGLPMDHGYRTDLFLNPIPIMDSGTHDVAVATGACLWIPKATWNEVGGFTTWFESVAEDIYICMAARLLGRKVTVLDGPGFDHWVGRNLGGGKVVDQRLVTTVRRRALSERNKTFVMLLCYPSLLLWLVLPLHAAALAAEALFLLVRGTGVNAVRQIYLTIPKACWRQRAASREWRARLKSRRACSVRKFLSQTSWLPQKLVMLRRYGLPTLR
jgi:hypothetical protein